MQKFNSGIFSIEPLPSPSALKSELAITLTQTNFVEKIRNEIINILHRNDPRLLLIMGPCSIHDIKAAKEYAQKLKSLALQVSDKFLLIMRVYVEKPRTNSGWKGLIYDPHLDGSNAIHEGIKMTRELLLHLSEVEVPSAAEFLDIVTHHYFSDLISWGCIGARTTESQPHRQMVSGLNLPIGFKNNTSGNIELAINGILCASQPQAFISLDENGQVAKVQTKGNPHSHLVLRGGEKRPNYDALSIKKSIQMLHKAKLSPNIIVDCSHDNSQRQYELQPQVFRSLIQQFLEGEKNIQGLILESHHLAGHQILDKNPALLRYGISITDPCLDWNSTQELVLWAYDALKHEDKGREECLAKERMACAEENL